MANGDIRQEIVSKIRELKRLIDRLKHTKSLQEAIILSRKKVEFSHFSTQIWESYRIDTSSLKYRCDAVTGSIGQATAKISRNWYDRAIKFEYTRWVERIDQSKDVLLSPLSVQLLQQYEEKLNGNFRQMCYLHTVDAPVNDLNLTDKRTYDEFIEIGCETLKSLYVDFEKSLLKEIK